MPAKGRTVLPQQRRDKYTQRVLFIAGALLAAAIIWIDIVTPFWQEAVILAGFAGASLSFLFTVFIVNRALARQNARRWAPMIRLALTNFLHVLADDERSEISQDIIVPRTIAVLRHDDPAELQRLREVVVAERRQLTHALSAWAEVIATSGTSDALLQYLADLAVHLDEIRDISLQVSHHPGGAGLQRLNQQISVYNTKFSATVAEIRDQIALIPRNVFPAETAAPSKLTGDARTARNRTPR